jgi:hypothetical protein
MASVPPSTGGGFAELLCQLCGRSQAESSSLSLWLTLDHCLLCEDCAAEHYPTTRDFLASTFPYTWTQALLYALRRAEPLLALSHDCRLCQSYLVAGFKVLGKSGTLHRKAVIAEMRPKQSHAGFYRRLNEHAKDADHPFISDAQVRQAFGDTATRLPEPEQH